MRDIVRDYLLETLSDPDAALVIDETGFLKQGKASCGVGRQYTGSAGSPKRGAFAAGVTNCQVGVFASYVSRHGHAFIDRALYLPCAWTHDRRGLWRRTCRRRWAAARRAAARHGVMLLDDAEATLAGVRFVGGTLWADGRLGEQDATPDRITGELVHVVQEGGGTRLITSGDQAGLHARTRGVIEAALARPGDGCPVVVVTHHAPHPPCVPVAYRQHWVAGNSASDLSALTDAGQVSLWVHGHLHESVDLVRPGGTRLPCNPAGPRFSNAAFRDDLVVEV